MFAYDYDLLALQLDEYLDDSPRELPDLLAALDVREEIGKKVIHHHRNNLSDADRALIEENIGGRHFYVVTTDPARITAYVLRLTRNIYTRQTTAYRQQAIASRLINRRTVEGKFVGTVELYLRRGIEDIDRLMEEHKEFRLRAS